jgi:hypothetical protein
MRVGDRRLGERLRGDDDFRGDFRGERERERERDDDIFSLFLPCPNVRRSNAVYRFEESECKSTERAVNARAHEHQDPRKQQDS